MSGTDASTPGGRPAAQALRALETAVLERLRAAPGGLTEHSLLRSLAQSRPALFPDPFAGLLATFRAHFLLFHVLYRLRDALRARGEAELVIDPLAIRLLPYVEGRQGLADPDALRAFYLDLEHLETTDEAQVVRLLTGFYARLRGGERRGEDLALLGLADPVSDGEIKQAYRRLAQQHHPDRGGDAERLKALNAALERLLP
jgi:hypothetical protein